MSLFDRLKPMRNETPDPTRVDIIRRGARRLDRSAAIGAGALLVVAHTTGPLPIPLTVEGDKITGDGPIYYQFVLPLDRQAVEQEIQAAATQPSRGCGGHFRPLIFQKR